MAILESMIRSELLWQDAQQRNMRGDRAVRDAVNPMLVKRLLGEEFERTVTVDQVDDREVERIYQERYDEFHFPEVWRLGVMQMRDRPAAEQMMTKLAQAGNNEDVFEALASGPENLDNRLRANEGNIGYLPLERLREAVPPDLRPHFERIRETDEVPEIVQTDRGVFIIMMTGHRPAVTRTLDDVRQGLRQQAYRELREKRLNEFVASFKKRHDVSLHYERLDFVELEPPRAASPHGGSRPPIGSPPAGPGHPPNDLAPAQPSPNVEPPGSH